MDDHDPNGAVDLRSLCGLRTLSAISRALVSVPWCGGGDTETVTQVVINLDGLLYELTEGANDSYRSSLGEVRSVRTTAHAMSPIDPPLVVQVNHRAQGAFSGRCDAIYMIDERTGLVVLDIGTDNIDDLYPSFVFTWDPNGWTPEWLVATADDIIKRDDDGQKWRVLGDFPTHAEAKVLADEQRKAYVRKKHFVAIRLNKKTMHFEVHERVAEE